MFGGSSPCNTPSSEALPRAGRLGGVLEFMASSDFQETDGWEDGGNDPKNMGIQPKIGEHGIETRKKILIYRYFMIFLVDFYWVN